MSKNRDPSKKRQPCVERREIVKLYLTRVFKLAKYIWLAYKSTDLFDYIVALLEEDTGPLDHYLVAGGNIENKKTLSIKSVPLISA